MADPNPVNSLEELVKFLAAQNRKVEFDPGEQALSMSTPEPELADGKVLIRWDKESPMVHILQPMVYAVPVERAATVARAICKINNPNKIAGLGYDESTGVIYLRFSLLRHKDGIRPDTVWNVSRAVTQTAKELLPAMKAVAGGASVEEAAKLAGV